MICSPRWHNRMRKDKSFFLYTHKILRYIPCDGGTRSFAAMGNSRLVYLYEDSEGELHLKCIQY